MSLDALTHPHQHEEGSEPIIYVKTPHVHDENIYRELDIFYGEQYHCFQCQRKFEVGEVISVHQPSGTAFCFSTAQHGCVVGYRRAWQETVYTVPMCFRGKGKVVNKTPNFPQTPVARSAHIKKEKPARDTLDLLLGIASYFIPRSTRSH